MAALTRGGWLALFRTLAPSQPDSDADLLARFVANKDEAALDVLVRRYAGMVLGVCRRRFGDSADADDAFQATFLVLAQQAGTIAKGASLPAWLHRVATLTSLKLAGRTYRRGTAPMNDEPVDTKFELPESSAERTELKGVLDEELSALPDVYRSALVLCGLEGKTNVEAAALLGVPVGTVDSRLHTAKAKLRGRLVKRGIAGAGLTVALPTGIVASDELIRTTVKAALAYASGGDLAGPLVTTLAREVGSTMTAFKFKLIASTAMILTLAGGVSTGVYFAKADGDPQARTAKPDPKKADEKPKAVGAPDLAEGTTVKVEVATAPGTTATTTAILSKPAGFDEPITMPLGELFQRLSAQHNVTFRAETAWFKTRGEANVYEKQIDIRVTKGLSVQDILDDVAAEFNTATEGTPSKAGFRVKGNQVIFGPVFIPPTAPSAFGGGAEEPAKVIGQTEINNMLYGPTVSLSVKDKTLAEVVDILREQTGSNIVVNNQDDANAHNKRVSLTLNDTKLFTVLKVVSDMFDLAPASVDNVFYITSPDKAEKMNRETSKALFGEAQATTVLVPVDKDGKFVPGGLNTLGGGGTNLVPVRVEGGEKEKPKPQPKAEEKQ